MLESASLYGINWNKYPSLEQRHHSLKPNLIGLFLMNIFEEWHPEHGIISSLIDSWSKKPQTT